MSNDRLFLQDVDYYRRNINPITHYVQQTALYISRMTGDDYQICFDHIKKQIQTRAYPKMQDPTIEYFERNQYGDRHPVTSSLSQYINHAITNKLVLAPTFTCYTNPYVKPSKLVGFVEENVKIRSAAKKAGFKAKAEGNTARYIMLNNEQQNRKIYNNSLSGAFGTSSSVLCNPTAHSTLTSTIRSVSSFGNASNERVVMGNRHYYNPDIVLYNLICCCKELDSQEIQNTIKQFGLKYPTVNDVMDCIAYSSDFYWQDQKYLSRIRAFVDRMSSDERAGFVYVGDLYHIRKLNPGFMRQFIDELSQKCEEVLEDPLAVLETVNEEIMNYAHQICFNAVKGKGKDYKKMHEEGILSTLVATGLNVQNVLIKYQPFIKAFFLTRMVPASHAYLPTMMRRSVVLSDTDSTCFSVDDWATWYFGKFEVSERAYGVCGAVALIATQAVSHILALLSANINVPTEKLHGLAMKNEYLWPIHMPTNVAKHYAAWTVMQEGSVFKKPELEIKGVHLKNSAAPPVLIKRAHAMMTEILETVVNNQSLLLLKYLKEIREIEQSIIQSISQGEMTYLRRSKIKDAEAYSKSQEESPYQHYAMWKQVFEPKYGLIDPPPYSTVVIPTTLNSKTKLKAWVDGLEDRELADRLNTWLVRQHKTSLNTLYLSIQYVQSYGFPPEIVQVIDVRKIAMDLTLVFRIVLEALGFFVKEDWLVSDYTF